MKIGVIGSGVSGLVSALTLQERFEVSLFEKNSKLGGHSNTVTIEQENNKSVSYTHLTLPTKRIV